MSINFEFTVDHVSKCMVRNRNVDELHRHLINHLPKYEITTVERVAGFLAQCSVESLDFTVLQENLNYSKAGLLRTFPKYFNNANVEVYARNPIRIANRVYADRMGNGPEHSGDGWKYRGMGSIQLTGREMHTAFYAYKGFRSYEEGSSYLKTIEGAIDSSGWFWSLRKINVACDRRDPMRMTKLVNGGTHALQERTMKFDRFITVLSNKASNLINITRVLRVGDRGNDVLELQILLGKLGYRIMQDGVFGKGTEAAVMNFQRNNKLGADGIVGPNTLKAMEKYNG